VELIVYYIGKMICAAIVETRNLNMSKVFLNHIPYLPLDTHYFLFTTSELKDKYNNELKNLNIDYTIIEIELEDNSVHCYNLLLTDHGIKFWAHFTDYDRVLIFQNDSGLLRSGIEEFLEYDYVGAPWPQHLPEYFPYVGNGGLSLRNPRIMMQICLNYSWTKKFGEDMFFTINMINNNIGKLSPVEVAKKFSVESIFELGTLGYHKPWYYLGEEKYKQIQTQYK
jgi:hypothetical protein